MKIVVAFNIQCLTASLFSVAEREFEVEFQPSVGMVLEGVLPATMSNSRVDELYGSVENGRLTARPSAVRAPSEFHFNDWVEQLKQSGWTVTDADTSQV